MAQQINIGNPYFCRYKYIYIFHHTYRGPRSPLMDIYGNFNVRGYNIYKNNYKINIIYNIGEKQI